MKAVLQGKVPGSSSGRDLTEPPPAALPPPSDLLTAQAASGRVVGGRERTRAETGQTFHNSSSVLVSLEVEEAGARPVRATGRSFEPLITADGRLV